MQATKEGLKLHRAHSSSLCCWYFIGQKHTMKKNTEVMSKNADLKVNVDQK